MDTSRFKIWDISSRPDAINFDVDLLEAMEIPMQITHL